MTERPSDGHAGDLLSAHLDGELDDATDRWVTDHLADCPACRRAAEESATARAWVRALPPVDATPVVEGLLARHRAVVRTGALFVGVVAVVLGALAATSSVVHPELVPPVQRFAAAHETAAHDELLEMRPVDRPEFRAVAPPAMLGSATSLSRRAMWDGRDLMAVVYADEEHAVSVYQQPGRLDWAALPAGDQIVVRERPVWVRDGTPVVMVTELGHLVVTVVSEDRAAASTAIAGLPEWRRTATWQRLHDACQRVTEVFALGG